MHTLEPGDQRRNQRERKKKFLQHMIMENNIKNLRDIAKVLTVCIALNAYIKKTERSHINNNITLKALK